MSENPQLRRRVAAFIEIADKELAAARMLTPQLPQQGMFFLQQSAEKLIRALIEADGKVAGNTHNLRVLADILKPSHPLFEILLSVEDLSASATRYRYPTGGGRLSGMDADPEAALRDVEKLQATAIAYC
jgi:HEPN domain-containing protein